MVKKSIADPKKTYNILIRWPRMEPYDTCFAAVSILFNGVSWSFGLVNKVWIEDVKFISLHNLWRWIVMIIVSLVVLVPLISRVNPIEIFRFSWTIFIMPPINLQVFQRHKLRSLFGNVRA